MSDNRRTIERYLDGLRKTDHAQILSCLSDDIEWTIPGIFSITGKAAFDENIENEAYVGSPVLILMRLVERANILIAEGTMRLVLREGGELEAVFCNVFEMEDGKIRRLTSYLMAR